MRIRILLGVAVLAVPLMAAPAHASASITCSTANSRPDPQDPSKYGMLGLECVGLSAPNVQVTVKTGALAGHHLCAFALIPGGQFGSMIGHRCSAL
ncbi:hypothetical protein [Nonomuraea typhae]|uniref:Secreted protein n=1 Tax=Nonomuraea typhae TaxID=2603600 RepID=A0ABW7Z070_9ACTN